VPLVALAIFAVLFTTAVVAWMGWGYIGLPVAAAVALGAIVSPPDAAAATAVLTAVSIPRSTETVLRGESLFNDASALLIFSIAVRLQANGGFTPATALRLGLAVPGGLLFGICCALFVRRVSRVVVDTLGGNLLQFVFSYLVWIAAERLQLSAILCVIAFAMTLARSTEITSSARMRVHSYAVWSSVVFTLNVLAFLLMGMQARNIISRMPPNRLKEALTSAMLVVLMVIVSRMILIIGFNRLVAWWRRRRGLQEPATFATAFALPALFPQRDLVVLIAFAVVLATLVVQGLTLAPLIRLLKLNESDTQKRELTGARVILAEAALAELVDREGPESEHLQYGFSVQRDAAADGRKCGLLEQFRVVGLAALGAERRALEQLRNEDRIGIDMYLFLQEEMDWKELTLLPENDRRIAET
jgi:CPA1 family monovalent cation:H+ antiporter